MKKIFVLLMMAMATFNLSAKSSFVQVKDGHFVRDGKPYYYVGTNFWYGAILGSEGHGGDRNRLCKELDQMKAMGIDNLRILVGADGREDISCKVRPVLQKAPGVYNDTILAGLDYLLMEMGKRKMVAVLYLNNAWEWSGGYSYYLETVGAGKAVLPNEDGYPAYCKYASQFATNEKAQQLFYDYVKFIMTRTNRYTKKKYKDDSAIMSWQVGNEPRPFSKDVLPQFEGWLLKACNLMRSLDKNHLISLGSEGKVGFEQDINWFERVCANKNIDYLNVHLWPYNWGWSKKESLYEDLGVACKNTKEYIDEHLDVCARLKKPLVMEEFGYPRDGFTFAKTTTTKARDGYYKYVFSLVADNAESGGYFAGCNFWAWGGFANPKHEQWQDGDDYTGDPAQEAQGLNSVFSSDKSTLEVVKEQVDRMARICK